jgi:hypothetical protein
VEKYPCFHEEKNSIRGGPESKFLKDYCSVYVCIMFYVFFFVFCFSVLLFSELMPDIDISEDGDFSLV